MATLGKQKISLRVELNYKISPDQVTRTGINNEIAGTETIYINEVKGGERDILDSETGYITNYSNDGTDVGMDLLRPVSEKYESPFTFTGKLKKVTIAYK